MLSQKWAVNAPVRDRNVPVNTGSLEGGNIPKGIMEDGLGSARVDASPSDTLH